MRLFRTRHNLLLSSFFFFGFTSEHDNNFLTYAMSVPKQRVFCYGDSLTAGTSPPSLETYPYAPHLENALKTMSNNDDDILVRWRGHPGWTSTQMVSDLQGPAGLASILRRVERQTSEKISLVVLLAGTNDLAYETNSEAIAKSILDLHTAAHQEGVHTLSLSIPPSGWQKQSAEARKLAQEVNQSLKLYAENNADKMTFTNFPIQEFDPTSGFWSPDGLHFSPEGYTHIGNQLALPIKNILNASSKKKEG